MNDDQQETEEGLLRRAYSMGLKMKNSNLDEETIYAKLEKQGIPEKLAKEVARNVQMEREKQFQKEQKPHDVMNWVKIGVGILAIFISSMVLPNAVIVPVGLIVGGFIYFLVKKR